MAPRKVNRDELELMIQEMDRGEVEREELEEMITSLELTVPDDEVLDLLENDALTAGEIAEELIGYREQDI